jgi:hypothetical protein
MRSVLTALCLFASTAHAVPAQFTHQGRLLDSDGAPLTDEATIMFRVTDSEVGGTALWEETITTALTNGFYSAVLGADEEGNPLDTDVLSQAPVWLELQLDGEPAMFPRSPINAVPYATMATVAEEVSGGPVDASQIAVDGIPVVNELGEWVGPAPTVNWTDIEGMPEDFADGIDDDTDTDSDSFAALGTSCLDGDIPVWDSVLTEWVCGLDAVLTADEVDAIVADNGYAMESEVFSSSFLDLTDVPDGLDDGDDDTQLSESEVDGMVADNGYAMAADAFSRLFSDLIGIPEDLADGDDNTQLSEDEVDAYVADDIAALIEEIAVLREQVVELESTVEDAAESSVGTVMYGNYSIYNSIDLAGLEGFTEVTGNLDLRMGDIPNIDALSSLTTVGGTLGIWDNESIVDLSGLDNLTSIGGNLNIYGNEALVSVNALESLVTLGGHLDIGDNDSLVNLEGLNSLTTVSGNVTIALHESLNSLDGLESLTEITGTLGINYNHSLANLNGLQSVESIGEYININNNRELTDISGLEGLESLGGYLNIWSNTILCNSLVVSLKEHVESLGWAGSSYADGNDDC